MESCEAQLTENPIVVKVKKNCGNQLTENPIVVKSGKLWSTINGKPNSGQSEERNICGDQLTENPVVVKLN